MDEAVQTPSRLLRVRGFSSLASLEVVKAWPNTEKLNEHEHNELGNAPIQKN